MRSCGSVVSYLESSASPSGRGLQLPRHNIGCSRSMRFSLAYVASSTTFLSDLYLMCDSTETVPLQGYSAQWQTHLDVCMTKIHWILCDWIDEGTTLNPASTCSLINPDPFQPSDQNLEIVSTSCQKSYQSSRQGPENLILTRRGSQGLHRRTR